MKSQRKMVIGVGWYNQEEWQKLITVADDRDALDDTYENWLEKFANTRRQMKKQGVNTQKVEVIIADLVRWCTKHGMPINGESRSKFVAETLRTTGGTNNK